MKLIQKVILAVGIAYVWVLLLVDPGVSRVLDKGAVPRAAVLPSIAGDECVHELRAVPVLHQNPGRDLRRDRLEPQVPAQHPPDRRDQLGVGACLHRTQECRMMRLAS